MDIFDLRQNYHRSELHRDAMHADPMTQFEQWFREASACKEIVEPNAMTLSTSSENHVRARIVLLKEFNPSGFQFFTNYESRKGHDLSENPHAALSFFWGPLERQVLISGEVEKLSHALSEAYFHSRPRESQLGAWTSHQSTVIENREVLKKRYAELEDQYKDQIIPLPPYWGGFLVRPYQIEFWQGRQSRLHDRFSYTLENGEWKLERLSP